MSESDSRATGDPAPRYDRGYALRLLGGDTEIYAAVLAVFLRDAPAFCARLSAAAATADTLALQEAAHTLKSGARQIGALRLGNCAEEIERTAREGTRAEWADATDACLGEWAEVRPLLAQTAQGRESPHAHD